MRPRRYGPAFVPAGVFRGSCVVGWMPEGEVLRATGTDDKWAHPGQQLDGETRPD